MAADRVRNLARAVLPRWLLRRVRPGSVPAFGRIDFGDLRRTSPLDRHFGYGRGRPVDRAYIEAFLEREQAAIRGHVVEVGEATYTRRFGADRVTRSDVLHVDPEAPGATVIADLADADHVPSDAFDCIVLTQTLQLVYDLPSAVRTLHRILAPGGTLLATAPGLSQLDEGVWRDSWFWGFTAASLTRLFAEAFASPDVTIEAHGNVLAAVAMLEGVASAELRQAELDADDPRYPVILTVRAVKSGAS